MAPWTIRSRSSRGKKGLAILPASLHFRICGAAPEGAVETDIPCKACVDATRSRAGDAACWRARANLDQHGVYGVLCSGSGRLADTVDFRPGYSADQTTHASGMNQHQKRFVISARVNGQSLGSSSVSQCHFCRIGWKTDWADPCLARQMEGHAA